MSEPTIIVTRETWLEARKALLAQERDLTHRRDALSAARRDLPWVKVDKDYVFESPEGPKHLGDLFEGRSQLAIYHFMLTPGSDHICPGCSFVADHVDAARQHFEQADLAFCAVSRAPLEHIEEVKRRLGWTFRWVSSGRNSFNYDFGVSFGSDEPGRVVSYNYGDEPSTAPDLPGASLFIRNAAGDIFHTYSTYARGLETLVGAFNWLDLAPKGRNEQGTMSWVKLHDQYDGSRAKGSCCT
ncbi:DUF899 domain-containing protein [Methylobacterium brachythecii]|uniref:Putative dithiol-disulfide oxidoreductase (DUF899 family) n=1 Tax=Methylobacterium brachythecii TaxID=1176177 RepID=A0A7W6AGG1_9HYPH|nr:thioredoxin family protein [Methylobacterium brachythecii]MBB3902877.1 putative dithiol-disulfide oxidoreductase (DUF899 family) [Methylobacterium brachythecii]GLS43804.1 hypothetical protein GCM10007884_17890 [Methylobacterium brachythecii]